MFTDEELELILLALENWHIAVDDVTMSEMRITEQLIEKIDGLLNG